jgi:uncharacterized membrane protein
MTNQVFTANEKFELERFEKRSELWLLAGILTLAALARLIRLSPEGLWYDELQSVTYAILNWRDVLTAVRTYDPHPPLYYLQLHAWLQGGTSDAWVRLNSVLWSFLTVVSLWYTGRKVFSPMTGIGATALFAVAPLAVVYAQTARMYAWLMLLAVWAWYCAQRYFEAGKWFYSAGSALVMLAFLYSHGTGFLILAAVWSFSTLMVLARRQPWQKIVFWAGLQMGVLAGYWSWLTRAQEITVAHTSKPGFEQVGVTLSQWLFGLFNPRPAWLAWVGLAVFAMGAIWILGAKSGPACAWLTPAKILFLAFVLIPMLATIAISYLFKPIWIDHSIAFTLPFWLLCLAERALVQPWRGARFPQILPARVHPAALLAIFGIALLLLWHQQSTFEWVWLPRPAVEFVQEHAGAGDTVLIANFRYFWAWCWYALEPGSFNLVNPVYAMLDEMGRKFVYDQDLTEFLLEGNHVWFVYRQIDSDERLPKLPGLKRERIFGAYQVYIDTLSLQP